MGVEGLTRNTLREAMEKPRIVITGLGVVAPNGIGKEAFWANCRAGVSGIKEITLFDTSKYRCHWAGEISNFQPEQYLGPKGLRNLDRTTLLALVAAKLAIDDAKLSITDENRNDIGVVLGSTMGSVHSISEFDKEGLREGPRYVNPAHFPNTVINSPASQVAIRFGLKGLNTTIATGFTASLDAMGYAMDMLRLGRAKTLLVGGVEELCIQTFLGFYKLGLLATSKDETMPVFAPCSGKGAGTLLGEGAAFVVLELERDALARNAPILAVLAGYGTYFDPKSVFRFDPEGRGMREAVSAALADAGIRADQVASVSRCANGVSGSEQGERAAIDALFAGSANSISSLSGKELFGETFSADGALRLAMALGQAATMTALRNGSSGPKVLVAGSGPVGASSAAVAALARAVAATAAPRAAAVPARTP